MRGGGVRILVIGAGIAGLAAARTLRGWGGATVEIFERSCSVTEALGVYEHRRRPRTDWVLAQTRRRDRARTLPPAIRSMALKRLGGRTFRSNYRPLCAQP